MFIVPSEKLITPPLRFTTESKGFHSSHFVVNCWLDELDWSFFFFFFKEKFQRILAQIHGLIIKTLLAVCYFVLLVNHSHFAQMDFLSVQVLRDCRVEFEYRFLSAWLINHWSGLSLCFIDLWINLLNFVTLNNLLFKVFTSLSHKFQWMNSWLQINFLFIYLLNFSPSSSKVLLIFFQTQLIV